MQRTFLPSGSSLLRSLVKSGNAASSQSGRMAVGGRMNYVRRGSRLWQGEGGGEAASEGGSINAAMKAVRIRTINPRTKTREAEERQRRKHLQRHHLPSEESSGRDTKPEPSSALGRWLDYAPVKSGIVSLTTPFPAKLLDQRYGHVHRYESKKEDGSFDIAESNNASSPQSFFLAHALLGMRGSSAAKVQSSKTIYKQ